MSRETQYAALTSAAGKFLAYISTIPSTSKDSSSEEGGLKGLVDKLSAAFRNSVLLEEFTLDPVLSFEVDAGLRSEVIQAIYDGLYSGAFIPQGDQNREFKLSHELVGQKFRITYLLAPLEMLPLRSGKSRMLSSLVRDRSQVRRRPRWLVEQVPVQMQPTLFID
ncbi:ORC-CDC6 family AAA ATPase [Ramlibacter albus]|uniref:ORC-CDC6 family AAA ATPase n=1 Tax=Ramlibacter albus TaxID=2079448 RepID=UPI003F492385